MSDNNELANKKRLTEILATWESSCLKIRQSIELLHEAEKELKVAFGDETGYLFSLFNDHSLRKFREPDRYIEDFQRDAWKLLVERMEIRRFLSRERQKELDKQLRNGEMLPLTFENIAGMMEAAHGSIGDYMQESIKEVHNYLRPRYNTHKTNTQFDIGKKVILTYTVEQYSFGKFWLRYQEGDYINAVEAVFKNLDGAGVVKTHQSELKTSIESTKTGTGETEYFKFKCHKNGNLHLEFKRMDLVKKLNAAAGGNALYEGNL